MIHLLHKIPQNPIVAVSGGIDSVVGSIFLAQARKIRIAFFHHGNDFADEEETFIKNLFGDKVEIIVGRITREKLFEESLEEYWRNERYNFLHGLDGQVITFHHLDDVVETYLFSAINGKPKLIPYQRLNVIRPFLLTPKEEFVTLARERRISYLTDPTNKDMNRARALIRHQIVPEVLKVNPGIRKMLKKMLLEKERKLAKVPE